MLSTEDYWAIILSLAISFIIAVSLAFFLWRGNRRIKKAHAEAKAQRSRNNHEGAQVCGYKVIQPWYPIKNSRRKICLWNPSAERSVRRISIAELLIYPLPPFPHFCYTPDSLVRYSHVYYFVRSRAGKVFSRPWSIAPRAWKLTATQASRERSEARCTQFFLRSRVVV